jgi:O-antigen/teichoic acid export membrane protein
MTGTTANAGPSLRANFVWMFGANVVYAACQWGILGLFARLGTPAMVGQLVLGLAITAPIMAFFQMQLRAVQSTDARQDYQFGHYFALRLIALAAALATVALVSFGANYQGQTLYIILALAITSCADGLSDTAYGLLQSQERMTKIAQSLMLRGGLGCLAVGLTMFLTRQPVLAILAGAALRFAVVAGFDFRMIRSGLDGEPVDLRPRWERQRLASLAYLAAPLGAVMMLDTLNASIPRYFVEEFLDPSSLGVFGAIGYLAVTGTMIIGAVGPSITPRLARAFVRQDKREFLAVCLKLAGLGAALGVAGIVVAYVAGPLVLTILYGPAYAAHADLLVWVMGAAAVAYVASFGGYAITAARYFRSQIPLFALVAAANALACWWLIPRFGLRGAALSLMIAAAVQLAGTLLILCHGLASLTISPRQTPQSCLESLPETA